MRYPIRWIGFWQDIPLYLGVIFGLFCAVFVGAVGIAVVFSLLKRPPDWLVGCVVVLPLLFLAGQVFWTTRWLRRLRARALASVAEQLGMTFSVTHLANEQLPPQDMPLMRRGQGPPRNILAGDFSGVKVALFDLATGGPKFVREQTIAYFPDPLPGLSDFPTGLLGWHIPRAYAAVLNEFGSLTVEARRGRLIIYRWRRLVRPESYPEFLAVACKLHGALAFIAAVSGE